MSREVMHADEGPSPALVELIHEQRGQLAPRRRAAGVQSVLARLVSERARRLRRRARTFFGTALALALVVAAATAFWPRHRESVLTCAVQGGRLDPSGVVQGDAAGRPRLTFSDGTEVALWPGAKAVLRSVTGHGARVSLSQGAAAVRVVHVPGARWLFDAGPFLITVTGTAFTVSWSPADEQLDLHMDRGAVEVNGPLSDDAIVVRGGQHLIVRVRQRETVIRDRDDGSSAASPLGESAPPAAAAGGGPGAPAEAGSAAIVRSGAHEGAASAGGLSGAAASGSRARDGARDWTAAVAAGDFEGVVRQAERIGLDACLAGANSAELAALADAARYGRHDDLARRALLAERRRFPRAAPSRDAPFLLGRLEEADHDAGKALEWYDRYLAEAPGGTYASEALGRKMDLVQRQSGDASARSIAREYLGRFPQGTYAERARALARLP